jgi:hypothetical protein
MFNDPMEIRDLRGFSDSFVRSSTPTYRNDDVDRKQISTKSKGRRLDQRNEHVNRVDRLDQRNEHVNRVNRMDQRNEHVNRVNRMDQRNEHVNRANRMDQRNEHVNRAMRENTFNKSSYENPNPRIITDDIVVPPEVDNEPDPQDLFSIKEMVQYLQDNTYASVLTDNNKVFTFLQVYVSAFASHDRQTFNDRVAASRCITQPSAINRSLHSMLTRGIRF